MKDFEPTVLATTRIREKVVHARNHICSTLESSVNAYESAQSYVGGETESIHTPNLKFEFIDMTEPGPFLKVSTRAATASLWFDTPWNTIACEIQRHSAFYIRNIRFIVSAKNLGAEGVQLVKIDQNGEQSTKLGAITDYIVDVMTQGLITPSDFAHDDTGKD